MILDALTDNEVGAKRNRYDSAIAESVSWTLSCTPQGSDDKTHILSIDLPSNTDPDTGYASAGAIWSINPKAVTALGLVKAPSATAKYDIYLVDIGLPLVSQCITMLQKQQADSRRSPQSSALE